MRGEVRNHRVLGQASYTLLVIETPSIQHKAGHRLLPPHEGLNLGKFESRFRSPPSSRHQGAMAPSLSPFTRTSAVTKPRKLAPTVGPAHGGVEFSKGALLGLGSYAAGLMTCSRRGKYYIDNSLWGPEADLIESGYRVPFEIGRASCRERV